MLYYDNNSSRTLLEKLNHLCCVRRVQFSGCLTVQGTSGTCSNETIEQARDATKADQYRHFAVDEVSDTVYFCDLNPYRDGMFCYCSNRKDPDHKNKWIGENISLCPSLIYLSHF